MKKNILLNPLQVDEIEKLKSILLEHKKQYASFKSFVKTCDDGIAIANALINNDYATFKKYPLKYSQHSAEKMKGIQSLSTYKKTSSICNFMMLHDGICKKCYAEKSLSLYKSSLTPALIYNTLLLKYIEIDNTQINYINDKYFRFESFSDLQSSKHLFNLFKVCKKNKNTIFTLWTKAGLTLKKMMDDENIKKAPCNFNLVISDYRINQKTSDDYLQYLKTIQAAISSKNAVKCFIVFDDEKKRQESKMYLCKNKCLNCLKCYKKSKAPLFIAEKLH